MAEGRTTYWGKDAAWWRRQRIVRLGKEFGPAGPTVIDWLSCEADSQRDQGRVRTGLDAIAEGSFIRDETIVKQIVDRAIILGALDDYQHEGETFTVRVSGWSKDQQRAKAARRQAEKRARERDETHPGHEPGDGRRVTRLPARRRNTRTTPATPATTAENSSKSPPTPPARTGRQRDRVQAEHEYQLRLAAFLAGHPCSATQTDLDEWQQILQAINTSGNGAAALFHDSHPHRDPADGAWLIGVHPDVLPSLLGRTRSNSQWLDTLTVGRRVELVPCPIMQRSAA